MLLIGLIPCTDFGHKLANVAKYEFFGAILWAQKLRSRNFVWQIPCRSSSSSSSEGDRFLARLSPSWYIPSEKVGPFFWPRRYGFFGINYHHWTWGNAFWPFLAHAAPWGGVRGVGGGQGGSMGPKFSNFFGATFGFQNVKFWIVWTENTPFSSFLAKFSPSGDQKCPFWAEMVEHKSAFFSKTSSLNCLKMHQNKVLGSILI